MAGEGRSGAIPRLQPRGKPGFPGVNGGEGQRFTTARPAAVVTFATSKGKTGVGSNGTGEAYLSTRQKR